MSEPVLLPALVDDALRINAAALTRNHPVPDRVRIAVQDNGMGISQELLTRIFQYGFTTRKEGHGLGLHSRAVAAQELGAP